MSSKEQGSEISTLWVVKSNEFYRRRLISTYTCSENLCTCRLYLFQYGIRVLRITYFVLPHSLRWKREWGCVRAGEYIRSAVRAGRAIDPRQKL